jgi:hypothetical protein
MPLVALLTTDGRRIPLAEVSMSTTIEDFGLPPADVAAVIAGVSNRADVDIKQVTASQAGNDARELYLRDTVDYAREPRREMAALMGTMRHSVINCAHDGLQVEKRYTSKCGRFSAQIDSYVPATGILRDLKCVGYYKVLMALKGGVEKEARDYVLQLNLAALILQQNGLPVNEMWLDFRPTGVGWNEKRELESKFGISDATTISRQVPALPARDVWAHYERLWREKTAALETGVAPPMCNEQATWGGKKCWDQKNGFSWCPVAEACAELQRQAGLRHPLDEAVRAA